MHNSLIGRADRFDGFPLRDRLCERGSERCEAIKDSNTDVNFGDLAVEIACCQTLAEEFDAVHFRLDAASPVVSAPSPPDRFSKPICSSQGFISDDGSGRSGVPWFCVLPWGE